MPGIKTLGSQKPDCGARRRPIGNEVSPLIGVGTTESPLPPVGSRTGAVPLRPVSSPRHVKRSVRISRTTLSCRLHPKGYGTYQAGSTFTTGSTVPRNPNTNQGLGISNPYSTCSSRSLCVFALASDAAVSSSQPSPSRRQNTDWNAQPENS